jgi:hypothetical protein
VRKLGIGIHIKACFSLQWSIDLLGYLSSKNVKRRPVAQASSNINEALQFWMCGSATKALLEITSECFSSMLVFMGLMLFYSREYFFSPGSASMPAVVLILF